MTLIYGSVDLSDEVTVAATVRTCLTDDLEIGGPPTSQHQDAGNSTPRRGALGRIRTCNLLIRSQVLYPLSYERLWRTPSAARGPA